MGIVVSDSGGGSFALPEAGLHNAVCSKIFDLGTQEGFEGKPRHELVVYWELEEKIPDGEYAGKPFTAMKSYTASLNEKARLREDLESWRGRAFTPDELQGFDLDNVIGKQCTLNLVHKESNGKTRAKVGAVMAKQKNAPELVPTLGDDFMPGWIAEKLGVEKPQGFKDDTFDDDQSIPF